MPSLTGSFIISFSVQGNVIILIHGNFTYYKTRLEKYCSITQLYLIVLNSLIAAPKWFFISKPPRVEFGHKLTLYQVIKHCITLYTFTTVTDVLQTVRVY